MPAGQRNRQRRLTAILLRLRRNLRRQLCVIRVHEPPVCLDKVEVRILRDAVVVARGQGRHGGALAVPVLLVPVANDLVVVLDEVLVYVGGDSLVGGDVVVEVGRFVGVEAELGLV